MAVSYNNNKINTDLSVESISSSTAGDLNNEPHAELIAEDLITKSPPASKDVSSHQEDVSSHRNDGDIDTNDASNYDKIVFSGNDIVAAKEPTIEEDIDLLNSISLSELKGPDRSRIDRRAIKFLRNGSKNVDESIEKRFFEKVEECRYKSISKSLFGSSENRTYKILPESKNMKKLSSKEEGRLLNESLRETSEILSGQRRRHTKSWRGKNTTKPFAQITRNERTRGYARGSISETASSGARTRTSNSVNSANSVNSVNSANSVNSVNSANSANSATPVDSITCDSAPKESPVQFVSRMSNFIDNHELSKNSGRMASRKINETRKVTRTYRNSFRNSAYNITAGNTANGFASAAGGKSSNYLRKKEFAKCFSEDLDRYIGGGENLKDIISNGDSYIEMGERVGESTNKIIYESFEILDKLIERNTITEAIINRSKNIEHSREFRDEANIIISKMNKKKDKIIELKRSLEELGNNVKPHRSRDKKE